MATQPKQGQVQQITYYRIVKPPSLKQYLIRRAVAVTMRKVEGEVGVGIDPETHRRSPLSAIKAKELLKGIKAENLMSEHPEWVEDYRREYGAGNQKT